MGKAREAAEHLEYFLREDKEADAEAREAVQEVLDEATAKIGMLRVNVDVVGAEVFVGDRSVGTSPLEGLIFVEPGNYTVEARLAGKTPVSQKVGLGAGSKLDVDLRFEGPKAGTGSVGVMGPVEKGKATPETEPAWRKPAIYGGIGLAVVGLAAGVGFSVGVATKNDEALAEVARLKNRTASDQTICPEGPTDTRCSDLRGILETRDAFFGASIAGYVVGGLATVGVITLLVTGPKKTADAQKPVPSVTVAPALGGLVVSGTF
ncbi:PEGA domain-containing protein [Polyangium sp. y55x31]|uniref:PEGA domain-containing protein n=1 Tax=Polyangium sp. y55x31 TaxID=3042688 RepID=UPI00248274C5|nr:PEGA domain-containing protein [Polyangium sp. y55x31]MDI1476404.1 PEGA domain-containing protein [Polyangium sp. y55x31]